LSLTLGVRERRMKTALPFLALIAFGAGCIVSPDYAELWQTGTVNARMVGQWRGTADQQEHIVRIGIVSNAYDIHVTTTHAALGKMAASQYSYSFRARDVQIDTNAFMLCPSLQLTMIEAMTQTNLPTSSPMRSEASLLRYTQHKDGFTLQLLNTPAVQNLIDEGVIDGRVLPPLNAQGRRPVGPPCVSRFDSKTLAALAEVFTQAKTWHSPIEFTREDREQDESTVPVKAAPSASSTVR